MFAEKSKLQLTIYKNTLSKQLREIEQLKLTILQQEEELNNHHIRSLKEADLLNQLSQVQAEARSARKEDK